MGRNPWTSRSTTVNWVLASLFGPTHFDLAPSSISSYTARELLPKVKNILQYSGSATRNTTMKLSLSYLMIFLPTFIETSAWSIEQSKDVTTLNISQTEWTEFWPSTSPIGSPEEVHQDGVNSTNYVSGGQYKRAVLNCGGLSGRVNKPNRDIGDCTVEGWLGSFSAHNCDGKHYLCCSKIAADHGPVQYSCRCGKPKDFPNGEYGGCFK